MPMRKLVVGDVVFRPELKQGWLHSLGAVSIAGVPLRDPAAARFLPWFDTYDGAVFDRFRCRGVVQRGAQTVLETIAVASHDYPFRERRDASGDLCLRDRSWDAPATEARLDIVLEPVRLSVGGHAFSGCRYWFEYASDTLAIHRLLDRQTWAPGGTLAGQAICLRNWLMPAHCPLGQDRAYSTVGLDKWSALMPGNLWARWSLLPGFELLYGPPGALLGCFDQVSCVRSILESNVGEDSLRVVDAHYFAAAKSVRTNPKTIAFCPDRLSETDACNLWTALTDRDRTLAARQFGIAGDGPPQIVFSHNQWRDFHFDRTYEEVITAAADFGADAVFIDPVWEHGEAFNMEVRAHVPAAQRAGTMLERRFQQNMCCTYELRVADVLGGEAGLKRLCDRAGARGVRLLSWMAAHLSPNSPLREKPGALGHGGHGVFAAKESGRHPDTGYAGDCWTLNLNAPVYAYVRDQILGVCQRTGLGGFLWDSFSNLGWWQVDYSDGSMRPQFDRMGTLYAELVRAGLYLMPEGLAAFSSHNCLGQHSGDLYGGAQAAYAYNSNMAFYSHGKDHPPADQQVLRGAAPIDAMFRAFAHKWVPNSGMWQVPRAEWHAGNAEAIRALYRVYRQVRADMAVRTVLPDDRGVIWTAARATDTATHATSDSESSASAPRLLWSFAEQPAPAGATDALSAAPAARLLPNRVYRLPPE